MNRYGMLSLVVISFALFFFAACGDNPREESLERRREILQQQKAAIEKETEEIERRQEALSERNEAISDAVEAQKEAYKRSVRARLDEFEAQIDEFRARVKSSPKPGKDRFNGAVDGLKKKLEAARNMPDKIESGKHNGLQDFKSGMDAVIADLEQSFNQVRSRFVK